VYADVQDRQEMRVLQQFEQARFPEKMILSLLREVYAMPEFNSCGTLCMNLMFSPIYTTERAVTDYRCYAIVPNELADGSIYTFHSSAPQDIRKLFGVFAAL